MTGMLNKVGVKMELDTLQDEPRLILTYPHKLKFNRVAFVSMILLTLIILWILIQLTTYNTGFSGKVIVTIVLIVLPLLMWFIAYYNYLNGVKLELYGNNLIKYYTYGSRGNSLLHFKFQAEDIGNIKINKYPFNCVKLTIIIKNPIFCGLHEKRLNKPSRVTIIVAREKADLFMQEMKGLNLMFKDQNQM